MVAVLTACICLDTNGTKAEDWQRCVRNLVHQREMAGGDGGRERSVSQSLDIDVGSSTNTILTNSSPFKDSDQESQAPDDVSKPAKPGRKKNPKYLPSRHLNSSAQLTLFFLLAAHKPLVATRTE